MVGVGNAPSTAAVIYSAPTSASTTGATQYGQLWQPIFGSDATTGAHAAFLQLRTTAASYTMTTGRGLSISAPSLGAGSAVTTYRAVDISNPGASGITNAYGIYVAAVSGAATINTAISTNGGDHRFTGNVRIGSQTAPTAALDVTGNAVVSGTLTVGGVLVSAGTLGTATATTSGTAHDYTSLPAGITKIDISFSGVSTNGTSLPIIQIGDSGGVETTNYLGTVESGSSRTAFSTGFALVQAGSAAAAIYGTVSLTLLDSATNTWAITGSVAGTAGADAVHSLGGVKALSATLDRVRLTTVNGTDAFDSGLFNIRYQ